MAGGQGAVALGRSVPHLRVPALVRWPAQLPAGQERQTPCMSMDWLPTLLRAAGVTPAPQLALDGCDLLPMLQGTDAGPERALFWRTRDQGAVRMGPWKLLCDGELRFLFHVLDDPREQANLKQREPERFAQLQAAYADWAAQMLPYPQRQWPGIRAVKDRFRNLG